VSRLDQGVETLEWTQANAYVYFKNSVRGTAAEWLENFLSDNRDAVKHWSVIKPHFRAYFGDKVDVFDFAQTIGNLKIENFDTLTAFYCAINKAVNLHAETQIAEAVDLPEGHALTGAQIIIVGKIVNKTIWATHDKLRLEFFINGLRKTDKVKIQNRHDLVTCAQIMAFLKRDEVLAAKHTAPDTPAVAPVEEENMIDANNFRQAQPSRGFNGSGFRGRGQFRGATRGANPGNRGGNSGNAGNAGNAGKPANGNGNNSQKKTRPTCIYCRIPGHTQEVCRSRISNNAPCYNSKGLPFFPKIAGVDDNDSDDLVQASVQSVFQNQA